MVNYSWGDVWDERQKREDIGRFYGRQGGYSSGSPIIGGGGGYSRKRTYNGSHRGKNLTIMFLIILVGGSLVYVFNVFGIQTYAESLVGSSSQTPPSSSDDQPSDLTSVGTKARTTYDDMRCFTHRGLTHVVYVEIPIGMCDNIGRTQNSYLAMIELNWLKQNLREGDSIELLDETKTYDDMRCFTHQGFSPMTYVEIPMGMCDYGTSTQNSYIATIELNWLIENLPEGDTIKLLNGEIIRG
ncbi:MAG: hypothetical protein ACREBU_03775 [Nitrososphaera sp.]